MAFYNLLQNLEVDVISIILTYIVIEACDFSSFINLLLVWELNQPRVHVKDVLERLNWDRLYEFHDDPMDVTRDQFHEFIQYGVANNVQQAMFYDSTVKLFRHINVQHHLDVLHNLSASHFPSLFSSLIFKAIYRPFDIDVTAQQMLLIVNNLSVRGRLEAQINLLADVYYNIGEENPSILPLQKFCPNAWVKEPFSELNGPPLHDDLWRSLCSRTIEEDRHTGTDETWGQCLSMQHIWKAECAHCTMQLIVFKILLSCPLY